MPNVYVAPELLDLGTAAYLTAAVDRSPRTDFDENGDVVTEGLGSRDICDPDSPNPGPGSCGEFDPV